MRNVVGVLGLVLAAIVVAALCPQAVAGGFAVGPFEKAFVVDPKGNGDFTSLDCALKKLRSLSHPSVCGSRATIPGSYDADYEECDIVAVDCDPIKLENPFTIYLSPGIHEAEGLSIEGMKGLSIIGLGGAEGTYLQVPDCQGIQVLTFDNSSVKIEGVTIGGVGPAYYEPDLDSDGTLDTIEDVDHDGTRDSGMGQNMQPPLVRKTSPQGPVELILNNCHFNADVGAIWWDTRYSGGGDSLVVSNSLVEFTPNMDRTSLAAMQDAPDRVRITGCTFRNKGNGLPEGTHVDLIWASSKAGTSGNRVIEFSGNTVHLTEASIKPLAGNVGFPVIDLESKDPDAPVLFFGTGNAIYVDTSAVDSGTSATQLSVIEVGQSGDSGIVKAYLTGNTIHLKTGSGVSAAGIKVDDGGQAYLSGNDILVESGGGTGTFARGVWSKVDTGVPAVHLIGSRVETAGASVPSKADLYQEDSSPIEALFSSYSTSSGSISREKQDWPIKFQVGRCALNTAASPTDVNLPTSNAAAIACSAGTNILKAVLDYSDSTWGVSYINTPLPADVLISEGFTFKITWQTAATTGDVKWQVSTVCTAADGTETDDPSFNASNTATSTAPGVANRLTTTSLSLSTTTCAAGEVLHLKVLRDPSDSADTMNSPARVNWFELDVVRTR